MKRYYLKKPFNVERARSKETSIKHLLLLTTVLVSFQTLTLLFLPLNDTI